MRRPVRRLKQHDASGKHVVAPPDWSLRLIVEHGLSLDDGEIETDEVSGDVGRPFLEEIDSLREVLLAFWNMADAGDDNLGARVGAGAPAVDAQRDRASRCVLADLVVLGHPEDDLIVGGCVADDRGSRSATREVT